MHESAGVGCIGASLQNWVTADSDPHLAGTYTMSGAMGPMVKDGAVDSSVTPMGPHDQPPPTPIVELSPSQRGMVLSMQRCPKYSGRQSGPELAGP